jgi:hypothetical protein
MEDPTKGDTDAISSTEHSEAGVPGKEYTSGSEDIAKEEDIGNPMGPQRNHSVHTTGGRRVSEWEALQIAAAEDYTTIDAEVYEIEADLQRMDIKSTWFKPQLRLKNPRYFNWLLVGKSVRRNNQEKILTVK